MTGSLLDMPKEPKKPAGKAGKPTGRKTPKYPSRDALKYVGIPRDFWTILRGLTEDGSKYEGRSVAYLVKVAVRTMLQGEGLVDERGKPKPPGPAGG